MAGSGKVAKQYGEFLVCAVLEFLPPSKLMVPQRFPSSRQSSAASRRSGYAKAAACSVCHVPHQSTVRRIEAVLRSRDGWPCHCCLCLTDPKKREVLLHLSRENKLNFKRESIISMFGSFPPSPLVVCASKVYSADGSQHCLWNHYTQNPSLRGAGRGSMSAIACGC